MSGLLEKKLRLKKKKIKMTSKKIEVGEKLGKTNEVIAEKYIPKSKIQELIKDLEAEYSVVCNTRREEIVPQIGILNHLLKTK